MKRVITRTLIGTMALLLLAVPSQTASAAPSEGAACSTLWKSVKVGKVKLQCADAATGNAWIRVTATPNSAAAASTQLAAWAGGLGIEGQADMEAAVAGAATLQDQLTIAQQQRDVNAQIIGDQTGRLDTLNQEIAGLPNAIATALNTVKSAESALEAPKQAMVAAINTVNSMSAAYSSAMRNQTTLIGSAILCTFGYGYCNSTSSSASSAYASVITQYNMASARADAAQATYKSYYADYKAKFDKYKALLDRQGAAQAELADANAKISSAKATSGGLESALTTAHTRMDTIAVLTSQLAAFMASSTALATSLTPDAIQASPDWKAYFAQQSVAMGKHVVIRKALSGTWQKYAIGS